MVIPHHVNNFSEMFRRIYMKKKQSKTKDMNGMMLIMMMIMMIMMVMMKDNNGIAALQDL